MIVKISWFVTLLILLIAALYSIYITNKIYKREIRYYKWRDKRVDETFNIACELLEEATIAIKTIETAHKKYDESEE